MKFYKGYRLIQYYIPIYTYVLIAELGSAPGPTSGKSLTNNKRVVRELCKWLGRPLAGAPSIVI